MASSALMALGEVSWYIMRALPGGLLTAKAWFDA
jgi:hypothetical protein